MAVKGKKSTVPLHKQIVEGIVKAVAELYTHHSGEIQENLDESESKKVVISFATSLDCSESEPMVTVSIRFSSSVTDKRVFRLDDSKQISLFETEKEARPEMQKEADETGAEAEKGE